MIDRRHLLAGALAGMGSAALGQTPPPGLPGATPALPDPRETIDLWPSGPSGAPSTLPRETVENHDDDPKAADRSVSGIAHPRLAVFRPARPNRSAVLIVPGGGYARLVFDKEGYDVARWLAARGFTAFVLFHRLPGERWANRQDVALADAQRAMRLIRARAGKYGIRPDRVAALGFSAGGHVCGDLATRFAASVYAVVDAADRLSARPDLAAPIYAVESMSLPLAHAGSRALLLGAGATPALERAHSTAMNVRSDTPPCFLAHAEDDGVVDVANTLAFRAACRAAGVSVETHLFARGGHGFGLRLARTEPAAAWPELFLSWTRAQGFA